MAVVVLVPGWKSPHDCLVRLAIELAIFVISRVQSELKLDHLAVFSLCGLETLPLCGFPPPYMIACNIEYTGRRKTIWQLFAELSTRQLE